ncbi:uncharacterized protein EAF01_004096 [Botrytis porri]|uniref:Uncharacterized protein n=1 Tax=Botrytis porri TaxID=87229 RepID=A0A4Z1KNN5_9HELO|nr:uncharacterized protein EAF01_004096 [Botrytis porri]KAF7908341.1 hypothetical protein EAF01_004096 [Botrytis porri]TGO85264.1 hypothetical protein BPOR_0414g00020 [Botrytis porri]
MCMFDIITCSAKDAHWMKLDMIHLCARARSTFVPCDIYSAAEVHLQKFAHWMYPEPCRKCHPNIEQDVKEAMSTPIGTMSSEQEIISQSQTTTNNLRHDTQRNFHFENSHASDKPCDRRGDRDGTDDGNGC